VTHLDNTTRQYYANNLRVYVHCFTAFMTSADLCCHGFRAT